MAEAEYARNPVLIHGIFDYRNAKGTLDVLKSGDVGAKTIKEHPELLHIIEAMRLAQAEED